MCAKKTRPSLSSLLKGRSIEDKVAMLAHPDWLATVIRQTPIEHLDPALKQSWQSVAINGEQALMCVESIYEGKGLLGTTTRSLSAIVVTASRLVTLRVHFTLGKQTSDQTNVLSLQDVTGISHYKGTLGGFQLVIDSHAGPVLWNFHEQDEIGRTFADTLQAAVDTAKTAGRLGPDVATRLRELQGLRRECLISEEEFQRRREVILQQI
jgi:hypothetical protein